MLAETTQSLGYAMVERRTAPRRSALDRRQAALRVVHGLDAMLKAQPMLASLAARCGQTGEMDQLAFFMKTPGGLKKRPWLVLLGEGKGGEPLAAAWVFEYRLGWLGTRVFCSADGTGRRNVLAPAADRARMAAMTARALMKRGAQVVHLAVNEWHDDGCGEGQSGTTLGKGYAAAAVGRELAKQRGDGEWCLDVRDVPLYLPLLPNYEATLATVGQRTRANLRYYRRRAEQEMQCEWVAAVTLSADELVAYNQRCSFAVEDEVVRERHRMAQLPGTFLCGIREGGGDWLALVGGRRQNHVVEIDWQMNRADLPQYSLSTVLRSYLIEEEIARGASRLYIEGGTPHSIQRSFVQEPVCEITVKRRSLYVWLLERFAGSILPANNYLGQILQRVDLQWKDWRGDTRDGTTGKKQRRMRRRIGG